MSTAPSSVLETEHRELVDSFASFVRRELVPLAAELPEDGDLPPADLRAYVRARSAKLGFYAGDYPEELGGSGMPFSAVVLLHHAAGRSGCPLAPYALAGSDGPSPLLRQGTEQQIERYLKPLVRGEATRCLALTEPNAGSDAFHLTSTATREESGEWVLTGRKTFVSNAGHADFAIVVAQAGGGAGEASEGARPRSSWGWTIRGCGSGRPTTVCRASACTSWCWTGCDCRPTPSWAARPGSAPPSATASTASPGAVSWWPPCATASPNTHCGWASSTPGSGGRSGNASARTSMCRSTW
ncbi:acyl-CoA dehydrogenase family protein [Streptomyces syringium]|uniref:acyl-CoA dehydrogenase family protein n=1 Tax=Streptomyces syringium TaxID=76729 RepID=UPI003D8E51B0